METYSIKVIEEKRIITLMLGSTDDFCDKALDSLKHTSKSTDNQTRVKTLFRKYGSQGQITRRLTSLAPLRPLVEYQILCTSTKQESFHD